MMNGSGEAILQHFFDGGLIILSCGDTTGQVKAHIPHSVPNMVIDEYTREERSNLGPVRMKGCVDLLLTKPVDGNAHKQPQVGCDGAAIVEIPSMVTVGCGKDIIGIDARECTVSLRIFGLAFSKMAADGIVTQACTSEAHRIMGMVPKVTHCVIQILISDSFGTTHQSGMAHGSIC